MECSVTLNGVGLATGAKWLILSVSPSFPHHHPSTPDAIHGHRVSIETHWGQPYAIGVVGVTLEVFRYASEIRHSKHRLDLYIGTARVFQHNFTLPAQQRSYVPSTVQFSIYNFSFLSGSFTGMAKKCTGISCIAC